MRPIHGSSQSIKQVYHNEDSMCILTEGMVNSDSGADSSSTQERPSALTGQCLYDTSITASMNVPGDACRCDRVFRRYVSRRGANMSNGQLTVRQFCSPKTRVVGESCSGLRCHVITGSAQPNGKCSTTRHCANRYCHCLIYAHYHLFSTLLPSLMKHNYTAILSSLDQN